jgi:outer membrane lipoprotein-sorting protein
MKQGRTFLAALIGVALFASPLMAQANSTQLTAVLAQMDKASKSFKSATADFRWDYYERVVHDTSTQSGVIYFERAKGATDMGAVVTNPNPSSKAKYDKIIEYQDGTLQMFDPGVDQITVLHEGANQSEIEGFLTLGFGGSGTDLTKAWNVTDLGPETLSDNGKPVLTEKLDLVGKDPDARKNFTHVIVWIDPTRAVSLKQVFYTASGDYRTAFYSHIRVNGSVDRKMFAIKKDHNTTIVNH